MFVAHWANEGRAASSPSKKTSLGEYSARIERNRAEKSPSVDFSDGGSVRLVSRSAGVALRCLALGGGLEHWGQFGEYVIQAERGHEVDGPGQGGVGVDGAPLPDGVKILDGGPLLQLVEILRTLGGKHDDVGVDHVHQLGGDEGLLTGLLLMLLQAGGDGEAELGEELGVQTVEIDVEVSVVGRSLGEGGRLPGTLGVIRLDLAYAALVSVTSSAPLASSPTALAIWTVC